MLEAGALLGYAAPVAIGGAELLILFAWVVLFALLYTYRYTLGALILKLADMVDDIWLVGDDLADALEKLDHVILAAIGLGLSALEETAGKVWEAMVWSVRIVGEAIAFQAAATYDALATIVGAVIPAAIGAEVGPLSRRLGWTTKALDARVRAAEAAAFRGIDVLKRDLAAESLSRQRGIDVLRDVLAHRVIPRLRAAERELDAVRGYTRRVLLRRIRALEVALGAGVIGAAAIAAITRVFPYWQCSNVRRLMRGTCRMNPAWLELLFGAGVEALVVSQLCDFVYALSVAARTAQPLLLDFVEVEDVLIGCHGATKPPALPIAAQSIPRSGATVALGL